MVLKSNFVGKDRDRDVCNGRVGLVGKKMFLGRYGISRD